MSEGDWDPPPRPFPRSWPTYAPRKLVVRVGDIVQALGVPTNTCVRVHVGDTGPWLSPDEELFVEWIEDGPAGSRSDWWGSYFGYEDEDEDDGGET